MCHQIVCYGDSNTYGYDPRSYLGGRYPKSVRWTGLLQTNGWGVINEGENGRSIPRLDEEIRAAARTVRRTGAEALIVMLGTNDLLQRPGPGAEVCAKRMETFLTAMRETAPANVKFVLVAPPPMKAGTWVQDVRLLEESNRLAECYAAAARRLNICFADTRDWSVELAYDGVHFSEAGHRVFAENMLETLAALLTGHRETGLHSPGMAARKKPFSSPITSDKKYL